MDPRAALFRQFDPMRPLGAEEEFLYVDWQNELDLADDVKQRLVNAITFDRGPFCRLFTGHRGAGKTTELNRVKQQLECGAAGRKLFVSMLSAEQWVDLEDVQPEDLIFQVVRQLVSDLERAECPFAEKSWRSFFEPFRKAVSITGVQLGIDPLKVSLKLDDLPTARPQFRKLLQGQLPTIYDLVNNEILAEAGRTLTRRGIDGILIIVDQLDRIPQKLINERGLTNHEHLFLDHAGTLRALTCNVLYTVPIELAYSHCQNRLQDVYGSQILTLPAIPVADRDGNDFDPGLGMLREIVQRRATKAGAALDGTFESPELLTEVLERSGGHVRGLFVLLRSILERTDKLPITQGVAERSLSWAAADLARPLQPGDWELLHDVHASHQRAGEDFEAWNRLLRDRYVLTYRDERGDWYDRNPLLELVDPGKRR